MISNIGSIEDVKTFFNQLNKEGLNFHPDDEFSLYINLETGEQSYTIDETTNRNTLLAQSFEVCEKEKADIYELCIDIFMKDFYAAFPPEV